MVIVFSLAEPPLFTRLRDRHRVLIAGAGGGFDVYAGKQVHLANLSFSELDRLDLDDWVGPGLAMVSPDGAYLGALSIPADSPEARAYVDAVAHAQAATPCGRASSTARSRRPCGASSVTTGSSNAPVSCS